VVRFAYEFHDDSGNWLRLYGNENWEFDQGRADAVECDQCPHSLQGSTASD
jgi:nuclear transport factor 2 (NTF2) superfamily protein